MAGLHFIFPLPRGGQLRVHTAHGLRDLDDALRAPEDLLLQPSGSGRGHDEGHLRWSIRGLARRAVWMYLQV